MFRLFDWLERASNLLAQLTSTFESSNSHSQSAIDPYFLFHGRGGLPLNLTDVSGWLLCEMVATAST